MPTPQSINGVPVKTGSWSPSEDKLLFEWQAKLGNKWSAVAQHIPGRTGQQCAQRWRHKVNPNIKKEKWTAEEDAKLVELYRRYGNRWAEIARHCEGRTDQQCMGRWRRHLDPSIKRDAWRQEEDQRLQLLYTQYGSQWSRIAKALKGRTSQQCRARWFQINGNLAGSSQNTSRTDDDTYDYEEEMDNDGDEPVTPSPPFCAPQRDMRLMLRRTSSQTDESSPDSGSQGYQSALMNHHTINVTPGASGRGDGDVESDPVKELLFATQPSPYLHPLLSYTTVSSASHLAASPVFHALHPQNAVKLQDAAGREYILSQVPSGTALESPSPSATMLMNGVGLRTLRNLGGGPAVVLSAQPAAPNKRGPDCLQESDGVKKEDDRPSTMDGGPGGGRPPICTPPRKWKFYHYNGNRDDKGGNCVGAEANGGLGGAPHQSPLPVPDPNWTPSRLVRASLDEGGPDDGPGRDPDQGFSRGRRRGCSAAKRLRLSPVPEVDGNKGMENVNGGVSELSERSSPPPNGLRVAEKVQQQGDTTTQDRSLGTAPPASTHLHSSPLRDLSGMSPPPIGSVATVVQLLESHVLGAVDPEVLRHLPQRYPALAELLQLTTQVAEEERKKAAGSVPTQQEAPQSGDPEGLRGPQAAAGPVLEKVEESPGPPIGVQAGIKTEEVEGTAAGPVRPGPVMDGSTEMPLVETHSVPPVPDCRELPRSPDYMASPPPGIRLADHWPGPSSQQQEYHMPNSVAPGETFATITHQDRDLGGMGDITSSTSGRGGGSSGRQGNEGAGLGMSPVSEELHTSRPCSAVLRNRLHALLEGL